MKKKSLSVYHLSSIENTLKKMPKYNPYQIGMALLAILNTTAEKQKEI